MAFSFDQARELQWALTSVGLSGVHVAMEHGGPGLTHAHVKIIEEELQHFDAVLIRSLGIGMYLVVSTLLSAGSEEKKTLLISALIRADELHCQLFSEPDAGSDLGCF